MTKITPSIIKRLRQKDEEAFEVFFMEYKNIIFYQAMRYVQNTHTAEDLTQEIFMKVIESIDYYDDKKGAFSTWTMAIARNYITSYVRKDKEKYTLSEDNLENAYSSDSNTEYNLKLSELESNMTEDEYLVLILRIVQGWKYVDISKHMKLTTNQVRHLYKKAVKISKRVLGDNDENKNQD